MDKTVNDSWFLMNSQKFHGIIFGMIKIIIIVIVLHIRRATTTFLPEKETWPQKICDVQKKKFG